MQSLITLITLLYSFKITLLSLGFPFVIGFLLLVIGFLIRRNYLYRLRRNRLDHENIVLGQKMKIKEDEIKNLIADNSMRLTFKEELLERLKLEIRKDDILEIRKSLSSLISQLKLQIDTENKLSGLQQKIDDTNIGFDLKLQELYPNLTKGEREVCALLRLNLSIKEIMTIRNVSLDSVKSMRRRIRKKMEVSSEIELEKFIQELT